ncbi:hypothetical protein BaRGS_00031593 [Batillaria attramentaria]|uniref:Uncharacterized protein n=1 Tax=Batillaria attramentaria TaxID=370345 RepID=A0ABD0JRF1_9CAEN
MARYPPNPAGRLSGLTKRLSMARQSAAFSHRLQKRCDSVVAARSNSQLLVPDVSRIARSNTRPRIAWHAGTIV